MLKQEHERKIPLNKQKTKRRTPTPDEQDEEFNRELKKTITLGDDFIPQFEESIKNGHIDEKVEEGISQIVKEAEKKRKENLRSHERRVNICFHKKPTFLCNMRTVRARLRAFFNLPTFICQGKLYL